MEHNQKKNIISQNSQAKNGVSGTSLSHSAINYKQLTKPYEKQALSDLAGWIRINSVNDETTVAPNKPFGEGVYQALRYIGSLAAKEGFNVDYCDGYCTEISFGEGPIVGIYAHSDIVPVSGNWEFPPFSATVKDGKMYGRGTSDDKGPAMAAFYAIKALKDHHLIDGFQVRLVIGGNEEKGSRCLEYYFHTLHRPFPEFGFTPDGDFPLIYGEKGISNYQTAGDIDLRPVLSIDAGVVSNSVIDIAKAVLAKDLTIEGAIKAKGYKYEIHHDDSKTYVTIVGKSAHGSLPELGINAGIQLLDVLGSHYHLSALEKLAALYAKPDGTSLGEFYESKILHATTYNVGLINYDGKKFSLIVNFRYPETVKPLDVIARIGSKSPLSTKIQSTSESLLVDPESPMIRALLKAYQDESGDMVTQPMTIGGGTYAKESRNTVAFGSKFPNKEDHIHESNEKIDLEDFYGSMPIYAHAIHVLGKLK